MKFLLLVFCLLAVGAFQAPAQAPAKPSALLVGGGASHDFPKWFRDADLATLKGAVPEWNFQYTDQATEITTALPTTDVLVLSANQPAIASPEVRAALDAHVAAGKGLVLLHAAVWFNWRDWPEFNVRYVGGGSRGHDKLGEFSVKLEQPDHPLLKGVPPTFLLVDELYYVMLPPSDTKTTVLATATSPASGKTFPSIWTVSQGSAKIVCIALGHDGRAHDLPAFRTLLANAVQWAASK